MKQRLLLSLCALLCSMATWALTFSQGQFFYSVSGGSVDITGYNSSYSSSQLQNLVIPNSVTYGGTTYRVYRVSNLGGSSYPKTLRVEYGENNIAIAKEAFKGCSNLTTVELTSCVSGIAADAFKDCSKLTDVYVCKQSAYNSVAVFNKNVKVHIPYSADYNAHKASAIFGSNYVTLVQDLTPYDFKAEGCAFVVNGSSSNHQVTVAFRIATTSTTWEIPASVAYGGQSWKVVSISPKANNVADSNLKTLIVRSPLTSIGVSAFQGNKNLTSVTISGLVDLVDSYAFKNCSSLTATQLAGIKQLGAEVFSGCTSLKTLNFGAASIQTLDNTALTGITNLENIEINNTKYKSVNGWLYNNSQSTLLFCPPASTQNGWVKTVKSIGAGAFAGTKQTEVLIPYGVTTINQGTFEGSTSLKRAVIPSSVTSWATTNAFKGCTALQYVICNMTKMPTAYESTFSNSNVKNAVLAVRYRYDNLTNTYKENTYWKQFKTVMGQAFDFQVGKIGYGAITTDANESRVYVSATTTATIPGTVTDDLGRTFSVIEIGPEAGKGQLTISGKLTAPQVSYVHPSAFQDCKNLTSVDLPKATYLCQYAFDGCSSLATVNLPLEMKCIDEGCFHNCTSLTSFRWPLGEEMVRDFVLENTALTSIDLPYGTKYVCYRAFRDCKSLKRIVLPSTISAVSTDAFENCSSLTDIFCGGQPIMQYTNDGIGSEWGIFGSEGTLFESLKTSNAYMRVTVDNLSTAQNNSNNKKLFKSGHITKGGYDFRATGNLVLKVLTLPSGSTPGTAIAVYKVPDGSQSTASLDLTLTYKDAWGREFRVVGLSDYCFADSESGLFKLPSSITKLPNHCFEGNNTITSFSDITMSGITEMGDYAFANCQQFNPKTLPAKITKLSNSVFEGCTGITEMTLPTTLTSMGDRVFAGCENLAGVKIPWGVTSLGAALFSGCKKLINVWIPSSVTSIAVDKNKDGMFWGCEKISRVFMNIRTPMATSPDDSKFSPDRAYLLTVYVPKGSVNAYRQHNNYKHIYPDQIKEGSYDISRSGGYDITECFDVKSWNASSNRGEVVWTNELWNNSNAEFAVDCTKPITDAWNRQFDITEIGERAFDGSGSNKAADGENGYLTKTNFGKVTKIGNSAFRGVTMKDAGIVNLMRTETTRMEIGDYAFADMKNVAAIFIEGPAEANYRTKLDFGMYCFGNSSGEQPMTNIYVPKVDGQLFLNVMKEWEKSLVGVYTRYSDQLGCIYRPGDNVNNGVAVEEFPFDVSFEGANFEARILYTKTPYLKNEIVQAAQGGWSVMLKCSDWKECYFLPHPAKKPFVDGSVQKWEYINVDGATLLHELKNGDAIYYYDSYADISMGDGGSQMRRLDGNDISKLPSGTIYVILPENVTNNAEVITPEVVNGIAEVKSQVGSDDRLYNLRGQRVDNPTKPGLYIINGRKVVIK